MTPAELRIGIAITTMNRREMICAQIAEIHRLTRCAFDLVICDDGSSDGTLDAVRAMGEVVLPGVNRGTAWNKNRGIFYLMAVRGCDVIILLDDDMLPIEPDWQARWVQAATRFGHVNFIYPTMLADLRDTDCTAENPGLTPTLLGCCMAFHRYAWNMVGYMDARFGKYGHEHTEFTNRFLRNGFGGIRREAGGQMEHHYYVIGGGISLLPAAPHGTPAEISAHVAANAATWEDIEKRAEHTFRAPWHDNRQRLDFLAEMRLALWGNDVAIPEQSETFMEFQ
jgi:glycosyltransferase involved in cell wall biosynthesis